MKKNATTVNKVDLADRVIALVEEARREHAKLVHRVFRKGDLREIFS